MDSGWTPAVIGPIQFPDLADLATSGIYFLHLDGQVVYVGKAVHMRRRIGQHLADANKIFDAVSYIKCSVDRLDAMERRYIKLLLPAYNQCTLAKSQKFAQEASGIPLNQPKIDENHAYDEAGAARFLGISVEELREHQRLGHGPRSVRRSRSKQRRYPVGILRKFAIRHLGAAS